VSTSKGLPAGIALLVLGVLGVLSALTTVPSAPLGADAPPTEFSAERAVARLGPLTTEPHPAGSAANARVRELLLGELRGLGLTPSTDTRVAGRANPAKVHVVGTVTDIRTRIPGSAPTGRVLLAAHYDSVAAGPGAGDDGSNVVAILEIARALTAGPPLRNDVEILLTDGEEAGLLGAKSYMDSGGAGDLARTVVLNLEARGSSGPAIMFQSVGANAGLMPAAGAGDALATSVSDDVYELLPNDTDLTVFAAAGLRGLNFAFVGGSADYHTRHDDLAHLNVSTVQDMGASALAAARELGDSDLGALPGGNDSYFTVLGLFLHYPTWLVPPLGLLAALAAVAAIWCHRSRGARLGRIGHAAVTFLLPLAGAAVIGIGLWWLIGLLRPEYALFSSGDTYRSQYYAVGFSLLAMVSMVTWYRWARRRATLVEVALASLGWLAALAVVTVFLSPGGAYLFTWPVLVGASAMLAAGRWAADDSPWLPVAAAAAAVPAVLLGLPVVLLLFPLVGISLAVAPLLVAVLFGATILGLLVFSSRALTAVQLVAAVAAVALVGVGLGVDGFDPHRPRPVSLGYALDGNSGQAYWVTAGEPDEPVVAPLLTKPAPLPADRFRNLGSRRVVAGAAPAAGSVGVPILEELDSQDLTDGTRTTRVRLRAGPTASHVYVYGDTVLGATVGGVALPGGTNVDGRWGVVYAAPPADGLDLTVTARGPLTLTVIALYGSLPADAGAPGLPSDASWVAMSALAGQSFATRDFTL